MKRSTKGALLLLVMAALLLAVGGAFAEIYETEAGEAESDMVIAKEDAFGGELKRAPVPFSHRAHHEDYKVKCDQCHHMFEDGKNIWTPADGAYACEDCHDAPYKNNGKMLSLYNAFHRNCKSCHQAAKAGPQTCDDCHNG